MSGVSRWVCGFLAVVAGAGAEAGIQGEVIHRSTVEFRFNANTDLKCFPGTDLPFFPTHTRLTLRLSYTLGWGEFTHNLEYADFLTGFGDQCGQFAELFDQPNPFWVEAVAERTVTETYRRQFGSKCARILHEKMVVRLPGRDIELGAEKHFNVGFVDAGLCD